jgi:hypothetical protein
MRNEDHMGEGTKQKKPKGDGRASHLSSDQCQANICQETAAACYRTPY